MDFQVQRKSQSAQTRRKIVDAALQLMHGRSFDDVSIREICRKAGVTTGAFYHHFPSKDVLLLSCFAPLSDYLHSALAEAPDAAPDERLRLLVMAYADFMSKEGPLLAKYYEYRLSRPSLSASFDSEDYLRLTLAQCIRQAADSGYLEERSVQDLAEFLHRHYRGIVIDWLLDNCAYSLKDLMLRDFDLLRAVLT